jgi:glycosyltransferase involved in cell wall biosynthesis
MSKVSILLAVYNCEKFIEEAIQSVIAQDFNNWELIIVNNGSTDNTKGLINKYVAADQRILSISIDEKGKCKAYNKAFELCTGDFICFFAGDDILTKDSLLKRLELLETGEGDYSTCLLQTFSEINKHNGVIFPKQITKPNYSGGSIFFKRELAQTIFPIPESLPNEDTWTSLHLRAFGRNKHIAEVLYRYRIHNSNSFGYDLDFTTKREKFLHRMQAFILFKNKWNDTSNEPFDNYVNSFIEGFELCKKNNKFKILFVNGLPLKDKLILYFYSSPLIYMLRHKFFKFFSGILHFYIIYLTI